MAAEILYEADGHVATIWLNRPERANAATFEMAEQLREALTRADRDRDVRVIVLSGKGKAFCSGDDVEQAWGDERMAETLRELADVRPPLTPEARVMLDVTKPMIAAVNGAAVGIGMDFALLCDLRIASEHAKFGQLFVKLGLMADVTGLWRLPQLVGLEKATELLLTGDVVGAAEAERIGLVSRVVPAEELLPAAMDLARRIAANPPIAVRHIKEGLRRGVGRSYGDLDELAVFVGNGLARLFATKDHREAAMAFVQKRPAVFTGE
ncbi:MAG TPA: enoyl-CoA hydratase-related protein [Egibacteraceae bacterium]|nr:enoyl-CoA hydratase-related protein [Egibacteraceae bacterium]